MKDERLRKEEKKMKAKRRKQRMPIKYNGESKEEELIISEKTDNYKINLREGL